MSSGALYKYGVGYSFQDEDKRVIDSNALIAERIEKLSASMQQRVYDEPTFGEDFAAGLNSIAVERLLEDGDENPEGFEEGLFSDASEFDESGSGNVIKAARRMETPAINLEEIEAEKERLLSEARMQAQEIVDSANLEAESIMENAKAAGYEAGYSEGANQAANEYNEKFEQLKQLEAELNDSYAQMVDEIEPQLVEVLTDVYEHIIHVKFSEEKEIIFHLIKDAMSNVDGSQNFIIHVSKEDFGYVSMQKKELLSGISTGSGAEIIEDLTLHKNECFIETQGGIFDCSLETQLSGLKRELRLLSYVKND